MFGHRDDDKDDEQPVDESVHGASPDAAQPVEQPSHQGNDIAAPTVVEPVQPDLSPAAADDSQAAPAAGPAPDPAWQHPGTPLANSSQEQIVDVISPAGGFPKRPTYQYPQGSPPPSDDTPAVSDDPANRDLIDVKEHALDDLEPLLDKLDLPPEEKFRAIMMILQANDDKSLLKAAYAAAHSIEDEETRARALYTIVNEVDYFTHPPEN